MTQEYPGPQGEWRPQQPPPQGNHGNQPPWNQPPQQYGYGMTPPPKPSRQWYQKKRFIIPGILILLYVFAQCGGPSDRSATSSSGTESPKPEAKGTTHAIGTSFQADDFEYTVTAFQCGIPRVGTESYGEDAKGHFCEMSLTAKNVGTKAASLNYSDFLLSDGTAQYETESWTNIQGNRDDESSGFLDKINPGLSTTGRIFFDVPKEVTPNKAILSESWLSEDVHVSLQ